MSFRVASRSLFVKMKFSSLMSRWTIPLACRYLHDCMRKAVLEDSKGAAPGVAGATPNKTKNSMGGGAKGGNVERWGERQVRQGSEKHVRDSGNHLRGEEPASVLRKVVPRLLVP